MDTIQQAEPADATPTIPPVQDTRMSWERLRDAAWDVVRAYGDEDLGAPQRSVQALQKLLGPRVRVYALPDHLAVYFDAKSGDDPSRLSPTLVTLAGYVEAVLPDGSAVVLKDRLHEPGPLPMSTEPVHMASGAAEVGPEKLSIWTDKTDYVVAANAEAARTTVVHCTGLSEEVGALSEWHAIPDDEPFPWQEEEGGPRVMIPAAEAVKRLLPTPGQPGPYCKIDGCHCRDAYYFASTEW